MKSIPHLVDFETPSEEAVCLHEAGHAFAAIRVGIPPKLIEIVNDAGSLGRARNRIPKGDRDQQKFVACGAFAVEFLLFKAGRLVNKKGSAISEKAFIDQAVGHNASQDKVNFFAANPQRASGEWHHDEDAEFIAVGQTVSKLVPMPFIIELAEALLNERILAERRIIEIAVKYDLIDCA